MMNPNYQELQNIQNNKIQFFCNQIGNNDISRAERYLTQTNWDEFEAVQLFFRNHPNHAPNNNQYLFPQLMPQFQPQLPPPSQISDRHRRHLSNVEKKENYLEFFIGEVLVNNKNNAQPYSKCLDFIYKNLKNVEKDFSSFLRELRNKPGIIIIINEESFNQIQEQIRLYSAKSDVLKNCVIYPVLSSFSIGNEFVQQLSIFSQPCYIFCKYKDDKYFYLTGRMEGAFDINFFINSIRRNKLEQKEKNKNINLNSKTDIRKNQNNNINNNLKNDENNNNIKKDNNNNIKKDNLINELRRNNYFDVRNHRLNPRLNQHQHQINPNEINSNINNNIHKNINKENNNNNNNKRNEEQNYGDYFLGDSQEMMNLFNQDNNKDNINSNNFNNFYNPNIINENNNPSNKKDNLNLKKNENILADSIYQLSDAQVLQKRENEMKALEKMQEEKEKKEEEEKKIRMEEEKKIENFKKNYEEEAELVKQILPEEPDEDNSDVCKIAFRMPDGEKNIERRFLKTDKVSVLYNYVKSIGGEIFTEPESYDFDLCIPFPPKNLKDKMNNTLEEEGLYPNSIIQIREKQK